ncbi:hypothetical protein RD110_15970 [Rhodoferax koreense]|uniref:Uncharacterized protein n=1 Tax=Rhodoferax koreensis TaxID=1842727 RepID=A0A1P8JXN5_9BURK|nr:hypothetical protein [Rhodoferax koreense]APW38513.1 hypothetical protein RD110_15970 [Rhodoferax koreense]
MPETTPLDADAIAAEMHGTAQTAILQWFANLLRVRIATQSPTQRALTMAMLQDGLDQALARHETQTRPSPLSEGDALRASLFKAAFGKLSVELMQTMGSGLTAEEAESLH